MCGLAGANEFYMQMTLNAEWKNIVNCDQWLATATTVTSFIQRERERERVKYIANILTTTDPRFPPKRKNVHVVANYKLLFD